jgi:ligand-binding SRPBCC domain-containing protein
MTLHTLKREQFIPQPAAAVFDFFHRAENLETITPPWLHFRILTPLPIAMRRGAMIAYRICMHGLPINWLTEISQWNPPSEFVDEQVKGPYHIWRHKHCFLAVTGGTRMTDTVEYSLGYGIFGELAHRLFVAGDLARIFDYRAQRIRELLG